MMAFIEEVGELVDVYSGDEGIGSTYDLAMEFASVKDLLVYCDNHERAKQARAMLWRLAGGINVLMDRKLAGEA